MPSPIASQSFFESANDPSKKFSINVESIAPSQERVLVVPDQDVDLFFVPREWVEGAEYRLGNLIYHNSSFYGCLADHTASASFAADAANWQQIGTGPYTNRSASSDGILSAAEPLATVTDRTTELQALINAQQNGGDIRRLGSGVFQILPALLFDSATVLQGEPSHRTILRARDLTVGAMLESRNYAYLRSIGAKWHNDFGIGLTGITKCATFSRLGFIGADDPVISDDPRQFNQATPMRILGLNIWGSGHRMSELFFHSLPGSCLRIEEGSNPRGSLKHYYDIEESRFEHIKAKRVLNGIELIAGADGHLFDIIVSDARDYGIHLIGHAAAYCDELHTYGCGIGIALGNGVVNASLIGRIQGDHDMLGARLDSADSTVLAVMAKRCKQVGLDVVSRAMINHVDCLIERMDGGADYTASHYSPAHRPHPSGTWLALYTSDPGPSGLAGEVTGGDYERQRASRWAVAAGDLLPTNWERIRFPTATASWGTVTHVGLWSSSDPLANATQRFLGGWALPTPIPVSSGGTVVFDYEELTPPYEPRALAEFRVHPAVVMDTPGYWRTGVPLGLRIRQNATGADIQYARVIGEGSQYPSVAIECRGSRPRIRGYVSNVETAISLTFNAMSDADIFLILEGCATGVRAYSQTEQVPGGHFAGGTVTVNNAGVGVGNTLTLDSVAWAPLTQYAANTYVNHLGVRYRARVAHSSAPSFSAANWEVANWPADAAGAFVWIAGRVYAVNTRVNDTQVVLAENLPSGPGQYFEWYRFNSGGLSGRNNRITILHNGLTRPLVDITAGAFAERFLREINGNKVRFINMNAPNVNTNKYLTRDIAAIRDLDADLPAHQTTAHLANLMGTLITDLETAGILDMGAL